MRKNKESSSVLPFCKKCGVLGGGGWGYDSGDGGVSSTPEITKGPKRSVESPPPSPATLCRRAASTNNLKSLGVLEGQADLTTESKSPETVSVNRHGDWSLPLKAKPLSLHNEGALHLESIFNSSTSAATLIASIAIDFFSLDFFCYFHYFFEPVVYSRF